MPTALAALVPNDVGLFERLNDTTVNPQKPKIKISFNEDFLEPLAKLIAYPAIAKINDIIAIIINADN